ncbi:MAG: AGE family epimerase/isomerase [Lentisphaeria bacterium]
MFDFKAMKQRYTQELTERVIPFWEQHSIDLEQGGFFSCLERDGRVYDTMKQMWMQWREVYMFAMLYNSEFRQKRFLQHAVQGYEFLMRHARKPEGGYYYLLDRSGQVVTDSESGAEVFSESFAAIACAELFRATGEDSFRRECKSAWEEYYRHFQEAEKKQIFPGTVLRRQFGHYMISVNVLQIMKSALQTNAYDRILEEMIAMVWRFRHPETGIILERINVDGSFDLDSQDGRLSNPGHALEGMWFIMENARLQNRPDDLAAALQICHDTLEYGWDKDLGGIIYLRDLQDRPLARNECVLKAWWPQNEAATAALLAYELSEDPYFLDYFIRIDEFAWKNLRDPLYPEWFAYGPVNGRQQLTFKGSRWKTFFHLPRYLIQCSRIAHRLQTTTS